MTETSLATRREWLALGVLALPTLLLSLDVGVLYLALPRLSADLGASSTEQLWIVDIYSFLLAGFLVTMGTLGDRIGRRRLLLFGAAAFGLASVAAAFSTSPGQLIASRAVLGVAGATLMPSTMALIRNLFPDPAELGRAIGVWFSCFLGGVLLGPVIGGVLLDHFWWGSVFLLGVPVMVLLLIVGPVLLPEYRDSSAGRVDLASVLLSLATILPVVWGLKELARSGWAVVPGVAIVAGLAVGIAFVRRQQRLTHPLLDLGLFRLPRFTPALTIQLLAGVVMAGISFEAALYLQVVEGLDPLHAGFWLVPQNVAMIIGLNVAPRAARRLGTSTAMAIGFAVGGIGLALLTQTDSVASLALGLTVTCLGLGVPMALAMNLLLAAAPPERAGSVASLSETGTEAGIALGVAMLGSLGTIVARHHVHAGPNGAFTAGLHVVAGVGAAAFLLCALITAVLLRTKAEPAAATEEELAAVS
ncbi:MFS transporter [Kribbella monticola]|uniref:MFS transporter n=1 Tax=Kribbella monticola TaxID=2185285 RepID=UPI000DD37455|nr:MFS transporter [Kribbella monticola]